MAASENQAQACVHVGLSLAAGLVILEVQQKREFFAPSFKTALPAQAVDCFVACSADQPRPGTSRNSFGWPLDHSRREGILDRVLGQRKISSDEVDYRGEDAPEVLPINRVEIWSSHVTLITRPQAAEQWLHLSDWPYFNRTKLGGRNPPRNCDRLVEVFGLDQIIAA
jgi:hypothetical protein